MLSVRMLRMCWIAAFVLACSSTQTNAPGGSDGGGSGGSVTGGAFGGGGTSASGAVGATGGSGGSSGAAGTPAGGAAGTTSADGGSADAGAVCVYQAGSCADALGTFCSDCASQYGCCAQAMNSCALQADSNKCYAAMACAYAHECEGENYSDTCVENGCPECYIDDFTILYKVESVIECLRTNCTPWCH